MACKWINVCPLRKYEQEGKIEMRWKMEYCENNFTDCKRFHAEEKGIPHPDNMMPDGNIKEGLE
jgi:hypothetical protein